MTAGAKVKSPTRVFNLGRPRILLIEAKQAEYRPVMQDPWLAANASARRNVCLMAAELVEHIVHNGYNANRARIGVLMQDAARAIDQSDADRARSLHGEVRSLLSKLR